MCEQPISPQESLQPILPDGFSLAIDHLVFYGLHTMEGYSLAKKIGLHFIENFVVHQDQGTTSQLIFFENAYLEFVHVYDEVLAKEYAALTGIDPILRSHWRQSLASPFGLALRLQSVYEHVPQFSVTYDWQPQRAEASVYFAKDNLILKQEPLCFILPSNFALKTLLDLSSPTHQRLVKHPSGVRKITHIEITIASQEQYSQALQMLMLQELVAIKQGPFPLLQLTLDQGTSNQVIDCRPDLPIVIVQ